MKAWEDYLLMLEPELGKEIVAKWLRPLKVVRFDACNLYLEASDSFKAMWFEEHMRHRIQNRLINNNNKQIKVHLSVAHKHEAETKVGRKQKRAAVAPAPFKLSFDELSPDANFGNFVQNSSNILGYKLLCESCAIHPETGGKLSQESVSLAFNPIYFFGKGGTGKTHLLMAAATALREAGKRVIYVRADTFTDHVVNAIRGGEMQMFRKAYRNVDALLIDDIEIFSRKGATQEELFHTFNTLHVDGKQIILSSSLSPGELKYVEPRLVSRFEWGIVVPLQPLDQEGLRAVLLQKAERMSFPLHEKVISFLTETFHSNTKALIRALEALVLRTHLNQAVSQQDLPLSLAAVKKTIQDLVDEEERSVLTPHKIIRTVAEFYGIRGDDILGKSQSRECALPRQIAMHLCRQNLGLPFMKIGDLFSRDHSTVMASVKQIQKSLSDNHSEVATSVGCILKRLEHIS